MKKVLLSLLVIILALGLLGAVGLAGYRYGFIQGRITASNGNTQPVGPGFGMMQRGMPMHNFGFNRGFERGGSGMMRRGFGFGFFPFFGILARLLFWGLIIAVIVWLVGRSGWQLTRTAPVGATPVPSATVVQTPPPASPSSSGEENQES